MPASRQSEGRAATGPAAAVRRRPLPHVAPDVRTRSGRAVYQSSERVHAWAPAVSAYASLGASRATASVGVRTI